MRDRSVDSLIATISFVGGEAMLKLLSDAERKSNKDYTSRLVSSQVVPSYQEDSMPAVREYREAMDRSRDAIMPPDSLVFVELMAQKQILGFEPASRLERVANEHCKQMKNSKHHVMR
jgi:hypothetical protein